MVARKTTICSLVLMCLLVVQNTTFGAISEASETEKQQYKQDRAQVKALRKSFKPGPVNDLEKYEKFADEIQNKWNKKNKELYARLMLKVCGPLSSGRFKGERRYEVARKYALAALTHANNISLTAELELTGHVVTSMAGRKTPKGADFAQRRKKDIQIRLHAWKRLVDAIDLTWDPKEELLGPNGVGAMMGLPSGIAPESVGDPKLRAEYEAALEVNKKKIARYSEQNRLHKWLKRFPRNAEPYIIQAYSKPPFDLDELEKYLKDYIVDEKTKARIVNTVTKNIEKQTKETQEDPNQPN